MLNAVYLSVVICTAEEKDQKNGTMIQSELILDCKYYKSNSILNNAADKRYVDLDPFRHSLALNLTLTAIQDLWGNMIMIGLNRPTQPHYQ